MTLEQILLGESKTIEYKELMPANSIKYLRTVVAFANGIGGKLIFGIKDDSHEVVGVDNENIFKIMDAITKAISDGCEPPIIPDVSYQAIDNKTIIIVDIGICKQKPYYIKSLGLNKGVFVRVSGTTRLADDYMVKELLLEGANRYDDQSPCIDFSVNDKDINDLCVSLKSTALHHCMNDEEKLGIKDVTKNTLLSWGVLIEKDGMLNPTVAFCLLSGKFAPKSVIQCGVFKGKNRSIFLDRREFSGPIQNQVEDAYKYVLSKINLGAKIDGLYRQDEYELPISSIREIIANAVTHRSYLDPGNVQVALYDDRLEVTSPGMLLNGVTIEKMKEGYSKVRNRAIASAFTYMKIIEKWGSGIPRMMEEFRDRGLIEPELIDFDGDFRVNLYRRNTISLQATNQATNQANQDTNQASQDTNQLTDVENKIIKLLIQNPEISQSDISEMLDIKLTKVKYYVMKLRKNGILIRHGTNQSGHWTVNL